MADYTKSTGTSGTIMIRDTGYNIEFWVKTDDPWTWGNGLTFSGTVSGSFNYSQGQGWLRVAVFGWSSNGNVTFTLDYTGTQGLGGPTTLTVYIQRATVPSAPAIRAVTPLSQTAIKVRFEGFSDGGSPIREWQITYSMNPNGGQYSVSSWGESDIGNLQPGADWYFWVRGRNDVGWGPWSGRASVHTWAGAWVKYGGVWREAIPYVKYGGVWRLAQPYVKYNSAWRLTK